MTRAVVIGSGHNGLVAAIHLAEAGLDVTVLEAADQPGGATRSAQVTRPGFVHDLHAAFMPMTVVSPAMRALDLERHGVSWVAPPVVVAHPFEDGSAIALHRDLDATVASLGERAGAGWRAAMDELLPVADPLVRTILSPLPPVRPVPSVVRALRGALLDWTRRFVGSVQSLGLELFAGDPRATAWLASSAQHSGLPPTAAGSGAFGMLLQLVGQRHGWPLVRGGSGQLVAALVRRAEHAGAHVRCDARVREIVVRGGRVGGVRLAGGEEIPADAVVSTITARPLAAMLPEGALPVRLERRLRDWRYGTAAFKIDYALSAAPAWTAAEAREAGVVHVAGDLTALSGAAQAGERGVVPARPALVVGQQSLHDPTRAPNGRQTLYVYAHVPRQHDVPDDEVAGRIEDQLERFAPGFSALVLARAVRPPRVTEGEDPSLVGGDIAGGSYELDQQLVLRPHPSLMRYRAPLRGLYVAGASVHPGGAVHGISGRGAARALLSDRRLRPWRAPRRAA